MSSVIWSGKGNGLVDGADLEDCVGDGGEGLVVGQRVDLEHVHAPTLRMLHYL